MFKKTMKIIISFHSISEVLKFEKECKKFKIKGRVIPIPREISAGCGMAWCSEIEMEDKINELIKDSKIELDKIYKLLK